MFNGASDIPVGWAVCDGTNGTPNLIGKFIKAVATAD
nr:MAG TPA: short tail fiber protein [Caudoviricetes sp.]